MFTLKQKGAFCVVGFGLMLLTGGVALAEDTLPAQSAQPKTNPVYGKYVNSMLIRTRTATTYPEDMWVFTLVSTFQDFTERRNKVGGMEDLPDDVSRWQWSNILWAEYGVTDGFQLGLNLPWIHREYKNTTSAAPIDDCVDGMGDASLYGKYKVVKEAAYCPAVAIDGFLKMPTGDKNKGIGGTGNGEWDETIGVEVGKRYEAFSLHMNPEYTFTGGSSSEIGASADDRTSLNVGLMYHATPALVPMIEWDAQWWGDQGHFQEVGGGILWFPTKDTSVKLGISVPTEVDLPWATDWTSWIKLAAWF